MPTLTIFFSDIRAFTRSCEGLRPEELGASLREYFTLLTGVALRHGATVDKYIGDAMLGFFGDPCSLGEREDARRCVAMALQMQTRLAVLQRRWRRRGVAQPFRTRIGIHTGLCSVGDFGSAQRPCRTILGAAVCVAARLQAAADADGILVSQATLAHLGDRVAVQPRPWLHVDGLREPVPAFAVLGARRGLEPGLKSGDAPDRPRH